MSFLVACVNLAAIATVRALDRTREITIRVALGATVRVLVHQVIAESALVALVGGGMGVVVALAANRAVASTLQLDSGALSGHGPSGEVAVAICVMSALFAVVVAIGVSSLLHLDGANMRASLQNSALSVTASRSQRTFRQLLVTLQVTIAVVLGTVAMVIAVSTQKLSHVDVGYDADRVVVTSLDLRGTSFAARPRAQQLAADVEARLADGPVAASALWTKTSSELLPESSPDGVAIEGRTEGLPAGHRLYTSYDVSDGFIRTMGLKIVLGRGFTPSDNAGSRAPRASWGVGRQRASNRDSRSVRSRGAGGVLSCIVHGRPLAAQS